MSLIAADGEFRSLLRYAAHIGSNPLLVQAAGGNVSLKHDGVLWVKASGTWLADAETRPIMVPVALGPLLTALDQPGNGADNAESFVIATERPTGLRPSIETTMHAVLPHPVVVHVHCVETMAVAARADAPTLLANLLTGLAWRFIPYVRPGVPLARAILARPGGDVLVLGNHGLVVGAENTNDAAALLAEVSSRLARKVRPAPPPESAFLAELADAEWQPADDPATHGAATDLISVELASRGSFYPDHVIFLGPSNLVLQPHESVEAGLRRRHANGLPTPPLVLVAGRGALLRRDATPGAIALARCLADVLARLSPEDPLVTLTSAQEAELTNWDAEAYRRALDTR